MNKAKTTINGKLINHERFGKGKVVGWVQKTFWRIEFDSGEVRDFLPTTSFWDEIKIIENKKI